MVPVDPYNPAKSDLEGQQHVNFKIICFTQLSIEKRVLCVNIEDIILGIFHSGGSL